MAQFLPTARRLVLGTSSVALMVGLASPAFAQSQPSTDASNSGAVNSANPSTPTSMPDQNDQAAPGTVRNGSTNEAGAPQDVVVTGSLLRRTSTETPSPVSILTSDNLAKAGITNINDAVRSLSADSAGSISTGFTNGFSAGGAAVSLRGLGVSSTLVLIDGQRSANFPLNDDGHNSYVDLNSIPFSIVDRVEVLKDGASSTYGADAIGGVVNVILKKHFTGLAGQVEGGASERGDAGRYRANLTAGYGDYDAQGFNIYVNGEYQKDNPVAVRDRGFPYNTTDLSRIGGLDQNTADSSPTTATTNAIVRATTQSNPNNPLTGGGTAVGPYVSLTSAANCPNGTFTQASTSGQNQFCRHDNTYEYSQIQPQQERYSANARVSFRLGENVEGYVTGIYSHDYVRTLGAPRPIRSAQPFGALASLASSNPGIVLPVYVCAAGLNCATAADRRLNPNNPFAASGQSARIYYLFGDVPVSADRYNDLYRVAGGLNGTFGANNDWNWRAEGVYARDNLKIDQAGFLNVAGVVNAINTGAYNFVDPSQNTAAVRNAVSPLVTTPSYSTLGTFDASLSHAFLQLPGGDLQVLVGGQVRRETLNNRSQNANLDVYGLNTTSAKGRHTVAAGYFEVDAPILDQLDVNVSGRYDHYSEGFSHFSPKVGVKFTPVKAFALRGTYSNGFRAPTFAENGLNNSYAGYSTYTPSAAFQAAHGGTTNPYAIAYSLGSGATSNPNLRPEKSRSFTGGIIFEPVRWLSLTVDYYNVRKNDFIVAGPLANQAKAAYYSAANVASGNVTQACAALAAVGAGYSCNQIDAPDPLFPTALPRLLVLNTPFVNAGRQDTSGIDFAATARFPITPDIHFTSRVEVTDVFDYNLSPGGGAPVQKYVGTLGPYELSSGAGTPRIRGNWQNTLEAGKVSLTWTTYYTSRIKEVAADEGSTDLSCNSNLYTGTYNQFCYIRPFITNNLNGTVNVNDKFSFYLNVINLFDAHAPIAPASYSGTNYLPTWYYDGVIGRQFRAGATFKF